MTKIHSRTSRRTLHAGAALLALAVPGTTWAADEGAAEAAAADDAEYGEPIVVTARRREEKSQDVPVSISVVSPDTLDKTGNFSINQIQQLVPSLQVTATNPRNSNVNIRGLGSNSAIAVDGLEYGVGFYVDGVYFGRPGQSQFDLIDLAQVEVLRGPQGTLFGKNTTAGALNITTRAPSFDPELTVEGNVGNYGYHQFRASASVPIVADKVAVRLSVGDTHRDGFLTNAFDGSDAQDYDNFNVRGQLLIKPTEDVSIRIIADYSKQNQHFSLNLIDGYFTTFSNGATIPNNIFVRAARTGYSLPTGNAFDRTGNANSPFQANMEGYGVSSQVDWDAGPVTVTSITATRWWDWYPKNDVDGTSLSINTLGQSENYQRQFSQEFRVASNGSNRIDYVAGLFYFQQIVRGYGAQEYGADFAEWNLNPAVGPAATIARLDQALTGLRADSYSNPRTKSYAAFGQADWHITDALTLTAGLRYTHEDKTGRFLRYLSPFSQGNRSLLTPAEQAQNQVSDLDFRASLKDDAFSGMATLSYKVTPDVLAYGSYSRGSKSGGLNVTAGGALRPVVDPEKVDAFELGLKSQFFDNRLTLNLAAFRTTIRDYQTTVSEQLSGSTATTQYIANIPKARSQGIEADLAIDISRWIRVTASAAYTDAKFIDFANSPLTPETAPVPAGTLAAQDLSGRRLPGVPRFAYATSLDLTQPVGEDTELYGRGDILYRSSYNATPTLSRYGEIPSYALLNARIGVRQGPLDFSIWARNLTQAKYYVNRNGGTFGLITGLPGDPRTFGATLRAKW